MSHREPLTCLLRVFALAGSLLGAAAGTEPQI